MEFSVTFDRLLTPGLLDGLNWLIRPGALTREGNVVTAAGNTVSGTTNFLLPTGPPDTINYNAPPFDVTALADAKPAAAFTDFPMTVTP